VSGFREEYDAREFGAEMKGGDVRRIFGAGLGVRGVTQVGGIGCADYTERGAYGSGKGSVGLRS